LQDTWTFDGGTWQQQEQGVPAANLPPVRSYAGMAWDGNELVLFGGINSQSDLADTWVWKNHTWTKLSATVPSTLAGGRYSFAMASLNNTPTLFGGANKTISTGAVTTYGDTYKFDGANWTNAGPLVSPPARYVAQMAPDSRGRLVLFGGLPSSSGAALQDTWVWDGTTWTQLTGLTSPPAAFAFAMAYDSDAQRTVMEGGATANNVYTNQTWLFDGANWVQAKGIASPTGMAYSSLAYNPGAPHELMFFGGFPAVNQSDSRTWVATHGVPTVTVADPSPATVAQGGTVSYTVTVGNNEARTREVTSVTDTLPAGETSTDVAVHFADPGNTGPCTPATTPACFAAGNTVSIAGFSLGSLASRQFTVSAVATGLNTSTNVSCIRPGSIDSPGTGSSFYQSIVNAPGGLIADYRFNEAAGASTASDASGNGFDASYGSGASPGAAGAIQPAPDPADTAVALNGNGGAINMNPNNNRPITAAQLSNGFSFQAWVKPLVQRHSYDRIFQLSDGDGVDQIELDRYNFSDALWFSITNPNGDQTSLLAPSALLDNEWQLVGVTQATDGTTTLYRNGVAVAEAVLHTPVSIDRSQNFIGQAVNSAQFAGTIDEAAFYNHALNASQMTAIYHAGTSTGDGADTATVSGDAANQYEDYVFNDAPQGYWRLDETRPASGADNAADSSGYGLTGTYSTTGVTQAQPGALPHEPDFSATFSGGTMSIPNSSGLAITGDLTLEAWIRPTNRTSAHLIAGKTTGGYAAPYQWFLNTSGLPVFISGNGTSTQSIVSGTTAVPLNTWSYVAVTKTGTGIRFYMNPTTSTTPAATGSVTGTPSNASSPLVIGDRTGSSSPFAGGIDEFAVYNYALTGAQLYTHYQAALGFSAQSASTNDSGTDTTSAGLVNICGGGVDALGLENWYRYDTRDLGDGQTAHVNVANGNLVLTATDSTPVQAHGHMAFVLRRTYNSQDAPLLNTTGTIGAGWQLNIAQADDLIGAGIGATSLYVPTLTESLLHPADVTLIDRDGTHLVFTPRPITPTPAAAIAGTAAKTLKVLTSGDTLCIDETFTPPAGVHLALWRYIEVNGTCSNRTSAHLIGYSAERPDRLRYEFAPTGELVDLSDGAGVELRYTYDQTLPPVTLPFGIDTNLPGNPLGKLRSVYESRSCTTATNPSSCRAYQFSYSSDSSTSCTVPTGSVTAECVTDPAGRRTTYGLDGSGRLVTVVNPGDTSSGQQSLTYTYCDIPGTVGVLCSASDGRGNTSHVTYSTAPDTLVPTAVSGTLVNQLVSSVVNRRGITTNYTYNSGSFTDADTEPSAGVGCTTNPAGCERTQYSGIDTTGRVADIDAGGADGQFMHQTQNTWDTSDAPCQQPTGSVDNNLCEQKTLDLGNDSTDDDTRYLYTDEGSPLLIRHVLGATNLDTTYGYHIQYIQPSGSTNCLDDTVNPDPNTQGGSGQVATAPPVQPNTMGCGAAAANTNNGALTAVYALSDRTQMLDPRGNHAKGNYKNFLTTYFVDDTAGTPANTVPTGTVCSGPGTGGTDTGLVCEIDAPAANGVPAPGTSCAAPAAASIPTACTRNTYDTFGQKTSMLTPLAASQSGGTAYSYSYYADSDLDASGNVSTGGWLRGVTDPTGHFVAFAYDRAGNVLRSWDRDATNRNGVALTAYTSASTQPNAVETDYGPYPGAPTGSTSASAPWRYLLSHVDQVGDRTDYCVDGNGNDTLIRKPNANPAGPISDCSAAQTTPGDYDVLQTFDAQDNLTQVLQPAERAGHAGGSSQNFPTLNAYDGFDNLTSTTNPDQDVTAYSYDTVNRRTTTSWTRGPYSSGQPVQCNPGTPTTGNPFPVGHILCTSTDAYNGVDDITSHQDANGAITTTSFDAVHRPISVETPRGTNTDLRTDTVYDDDGNVLRTCTPRDFTDGGLDPTPTNLTSCPTPNAANPLDATVTPALYGTTSGYDNANHPIETVTYRAPTGSNDTTINPTDPAAHVTIAVTCNAYDPDGNKISTETPNGNATTCTTPSSFNPNYTTVFTYNLLDRLTDTNTPQTSGVTQHSHTDYSPAGDQTTAIDPIGTGSAGAAGNQTLHAYDPAHRLTDTLVAATTSVGGAPATGSDDQRTHYSYDNDSNIVTTIGPHGYTAGANPDAYAVRTAYDEDDRPIDSYVPRYDTGSTPTPTGDTEQAAECPVGAPNYPTTVGVCTTRITYDPAGRRTRIDLPTGTALPGSNRYLMYSYTDDGLLSAVTGPDPSQNDPTNTSRLTVASYLYDGNGKTIQVSDEANRTTTTTYTADELPLSITQPTGAGGLAHVTVNTYDAAGNTSCTATGVTDATTSCTSPGASAQQTVITYFSDNKTQAVTAGNNDGATNGGNTTQYGYDPNGNPTSVYSPNAVAAGLTATPNAATINTYTFNDLLAATQTPITADGTGNRTVSYNYDPAGRKTSVATTTKATDGTTNDGGTQTFTYYDNGLQHTVTGRATNTQATTSTGTITATYTADGRLASSTDSTAGHTLNYSYYLDDTLRTATDTATTPSSCTDTTTPITCYAYDGSGNITTRTYNGTQTTNYTYNNAELPDAETSTAFNTSSSGYTWTYDQLGRLIATTYPGGTQQLNDTYNTDDTLAEHKLTTTATPAVTIADWTYTYDTNYRITTQNLSATSLANPDGTPRTGMYSYSYDGAGRLTSFTDTDPTTQAARTRTITYDHDNNRTGYGTNNSTNGCSADSATTCYTYNADDTIHTATDTTGTHTYTYDGTGRLANDGTTSYCYDGLDRLTTTASPGDSNCSTPAAAYTYDGLDRQTSHQNGSNPTVTVHYDGAAQTMLEEQSTAFDANYQPDATGTPVISETSAGTQTLTTDGNGNITTITPAATTTGIPDCTARFDPFGQPEQATARTNTDPVCNTGGAHTDTFYQAARRDATTGDYQFGARTYDPTKAAFTQPDTYRDAQPDADLGVGTDPLTRNTYTYVNGDPVNLTDPNGHRPCASNNDVDTLCAALTKVGMRAQIQRKVIAWDVSFVRRLVDAAIGQARASAFGTYASCAYRNGAGAYQPALADFGRDPDMCANGNRLGAAIWAQLDQQQSFGTAFTHSAIGGLFNDARGCFTHGDAKGFVNTALNAALFVPGIDVGDIAARGAAHEIEDVAAKELVTDVAHTPGALSDDTLVVRGGSAQSLSPESLAESLGTHPSGVSGWSAQSQQGACLEDLCVFIPNRQVGVTTAGAIRNAGGEVVITEGRGFHVTITGISPEDLSALFEVIRNPLR